MVCKSEVMRRWWAGSTGCEAPGSFTQTSCSSLYFCKAGFNLLIRSGSLSLLRALMSLTTSFSSLGGAPRTNEEHMSVAEDIARVKGRGMIWSCAAGGCKTGTLELGLQSEVDELPPGLKAGYLHSLFIARDFTSERRQASSRYLGVCCSYQAWRREATSPSYVWTHQESDQRRKD